MDLNTQKSRSIKSDKRNVISRLFRGKEHRSTIAIPNLIENISDSELLESIKSAKKEWIDANINFEYVGEKDIVDYYTYKILACQVRYEYFLKKAKEKGFKGELLVEEI
jgi:hypothetical protein